MAEPAISSVPLENLTISQGMSIALVGNPNAGKSTIFNRLTGLRQKTANYPGVTVEKKVGKLNLSGSLYDLIDLPGIYSLSPQSADESIAVDVLLGRVEGTPQPDLIIAVIDATRLYQGLYLLQQLVELGRPIVIALTMTDDAIIKNISINTRQLQDKFQGVPVCELVATTGKGMRSLDTVIRNTIGKNYPQKNSYWKELRNASNEIHQKIGESSLKLVDIERAIINADPVAIESIQNVLGPETNSELLRYRSELCGSEPPIAVEARVRYSWIKEALPILESKAKAPIRWATKITNWINRPLTATVLFFGLMAIIFQAVFAWATPLMDFIDNTTVGLGTWVQDVIPPGIISSFIADGVIAGVGSVVIFLPQILILFLFIIVLEDTGYLARTAFLMDRAMRATGLSGQSVIPLISGFACAVPGIMATRVIPDRRDRIATILAAPFMTCSARLPVYALLIAAFIPNINVGFANLQGLVLFGLYMLGIIGGIGTALLLKRSALRGPNPTFILALPEFHIPSFRTVLLKLLDRARIFLRRAGTVIFTVAVLVWALAYFPRSTNIETERVEAQAQASTVLTGSILETELNTIDNEAAAAQLAQSYLGRMGNWIEPVFTPLGWDWRISSAVIAAFPAREVVVAVLGTIYAVGAEADETSLVERLRSATWPDGRTVFTLPTVLGLLVFFAWCLQCAATLAVIKRETNTWRWPVFAWSYMTAIGYIGALLIYQIGSV